MELKEMIRILCEEKGPSGFEGRVGEKAAELLRPFVDEISTDVMGNVIAYRRCGRENAPAVMLDAHIDEIGLIVTGYEKGFLRFQNLGGVDPRMLPALEVFVLTDPPIRGVIDSLPPHILSAEDQEKPFDPEKLFVDIGMTEEEAKTAVPLGTPIVFSTPFSELGHNQLCCKSLDDRSCAALLIAVMERTMGKSLPVDIAVHFAVQEEVGGRGAIVGAYAIRPESAIIVDVTHAHTPDASKSETMVRNGGVAIAVGPNMARSVSDKLIALAEDQGIRYQIEVEPRGSGTDAEEIQISRDGVATGVLSLPLKYMHTPAEVIDLRDAEAVAELIAAWLETYGEVN